MAITIDIDTARPYQVHVGTFLLEQAGPLVRATAGGTKAVIVTDTNVGPLYQMPVKQSLEASGYEVSICTFEAGEAHKRAETYVAILEFVAEHELSRSDVIDRGTRRRCRGRRGGLCGRHLHARLQVCANPDEPARHGGFVGGRQDRHRPGRRQELGRRFLAAERGYR